MDTFETFNRLMCATKFSQTGSSGILQAIVLCCAVWIIKFLNPSFSKFNDFLNRLKMVVRVLETEKKC